jgi:hypothetical protein
VLYKESSFVQLSIFHFLVATSQSFLANFYLLLAKKFVYAPIPDFMGRFRFLCTIFQFYARFSSFMRGFPVLCTDPVFGIDSGFYASSTKKEPPSMLENDSFYYYLLRLVFATVANSANAFSSFTARSANILRLTSIPASFNPCIKRL